MKRQLALTLLSVQLLLGCQQQQTAANGQRQLPAPSTIVSTEIALVTSSDPWISSYNGQPLPSPPDGMKSFPPPAWLVTNNKVVPATYGSVTLADALPPELMDNIVTVHISATTTLTIVVGMDEIEEIEAGTQTWGESTGQYTKLDIERRDSQQPAFSLQPITDTKDQILLVFVRFATKNPNNNEHTYIGDAIYIWHIRN